jgi:hypothetical protein
LLGWWHYECDEMDHWVIMNWECRSKLRWWTNYRPENPNPTLLTSKNSSAGWLVVSLNLSTHSLKNCQIINYIINCINPFQQRYWELSMVICNWQRVPPMAPVPALGTEGTVISEKQITRRTRQWNHLRDLQTEKISNCSFSCLMNLLNAEGRS